ncbi:hypothetical protein [Methylobacterium nigriterrae]|uniref:hypothetical protein n=1 Tax=Methylobacterium nigriterrae TaxID=3127512 RepID=UPI0030136971
MADGARCCGRKQALKFSNSRLEHERRENFSRIVAIDAARVVMVNAALTFRVEHRIS